MTIEAMLVVSHDCQADLDRLQDHCEALGNRRMFADAIDKDRIARGEQPTAPLTEQRIYDDDIEVYAPANVRSRLAAEAHSLADEHIAEIAFAVLRVHASDALWKALTYSSGPYEVTTPALVLRDLGSAFYCAGIAAGVAASKPFTNPGRP